MRVNKLSHHLTLHSAGAHYPPLYWPTVRLQDLLELKDDVRHVQLVKEIHMKGTQPCKPVLIIYRSQSKHSGFLNFHGNRCLLGWRMINYCSPQLYKNSESFSRWPEHKWARRRCFYIHVTYEGKKFFFSIVASRVWVFPPPLSVFTTQPEVKEWQNSIHRSPTPPKILREKPKATTKVTLRATN